MMRHIRPEVESGQFTVDANTGPAREAQMRAEAALGAAQTKADDRRLSEMEAKHRRGVAEAEFREQRERAGRARNLHGEANRSVNELDTASQFQNIGTRVKAAEESASLSEKTAELNKRNLEYVQTQKELTQSLVELENARYEAGVAALDVQRNRLDLLRQEEEFGKSAARAFGLMSEGDKQAIVEAARQAKEAGIDSLTQEQKGGLASNPATRDFQARLAEERGRNDPRLRELNEITGDRGLGNVEAERRNLEQEIARESAELTARFKESLATVMTESAKDLSDALLQVMKSSITQVVNDIRTQ